MLPFELRQIGGQPVSLELLAERSIHEAREAASSRRFPCFSHELFIQGKGQLFRRHPHILA